MLDTASDRPVFTSAAALKLWLSEALVHETDPLAILRTTAEAVGRYLRATRIGYGDVEPGEDWMTIPIDWTDGVPSLVGRIPIYRGNLFVQAYQRGETVVVPEIRDLDLPADEAAMMERTFCRSCVSVPLVDEGEFVALFSATCREPREWTAEEVELVESVGARTWAALRHARAVARLRESEEQFRQLAENFPGICWLAGTDGLAYWMNARGLDYYGGTGAARGDAAAVVHPDDLPAAMALMTEALREGKAVEATVRCKGADGAHHPFLSRMVPIHDEAGAIARWCGVQVDLTEKHSRDRHEAFFRHVSEAIRDELDASRILAVASDALREHLDVDFVVYSEAREMAGVFASLHGSAADPEGRWDDGPVQAPAGFAPLLAELERGGTVVSRDLNELTPVITPEVRDFFGERRVRSGVSVPLVKDGRLIVILSAQHGAPRDWTPAEVRLVEELAERTWSAYSRAQAEAALTESERRQRFLVEWGDAVRDQASAAAIMSATLERLAGQLGASRANYSEVSEDGESFTILSEWRRDPAAAATLGGSHRLDRVGGDIGRRFRRGEVVGSEDVEADPLIDDGARAGYRLRTVGAFLSVPLVREGRVRAVFSVQQTRPRRWTEGDRRLLGDVADRAWAALERARAEEALKERERNGAFLLAWSDAVRAQTSPEGIVEVTIGHLGRHLGAARANYAEGAEDGLRFSVAQEWRRDAAPGGALLPRREGLSDGVHEAYLTGEVVAVDDVRADGRFPPAARRSYAAVDAVSFLGVPMIRGGRVRAVLSVQHARAHRWRPAEVQLMRDVADRTGVMLERARAEAALQARERDQAFVIEWGDAVRGETGPRAILAATLGRLGAYLGVDRASYGEVVELGDQLETIEEWGTAEDLTGRRFPFAALGEGVIASHLTGRPLAVDDVTDHPLFDLANQRTCAAAGVRSYISVPLVENGRLAAVLSVQQSVPRAWTDAELRLVRDIAERTWTALERARFEERMAESEALLATFMENAPVGMHLKDADGRYLRVNQELSHALGRSREDILGHRASEILDLDTARQVERLEREAAAGRRVSAELSREGDGRYAAALSIAFPIGGHGPARTGGFTIDLTERKAAEEALRRSREALYQTEKLSALGSLLAGVSHELNNPLSIVVAQAVMMERQAAGTDLADRAFRIRRAADRCSRIVQTFLGMARAKRPEREPVDLNAVAVAAMDLADYGMRTDGVAVERRLSPGLPRIAADADQLHQVIINLLVNAQQAMKEADTPGRRLVVATGRGPEPDTVVLDVADNGPGVPDEIRRRVFEPFFTTKPQGEGTGVGLSFSQGLAEAHGGRLALVPSEAGATFRLTLPIDSSLTLPCVQPEAAPVQPAQARRALVVDDEREIAESLADFLAVEGFECEVAIGGAAAKERLGDGLYDLIVSDLRMPGVDGPELHAWVTAARPDLAGRMAFTTGDTLGATAARFLDGTRLPVLEKPFTPESVRELIGRVEGAASSSPSEARGG